MPRELNPRQMFSTRQMRGGSRYFDGAFPFAAGLSIGLAFGLWLALGNPERLRFSTGGIGHPLFTGAMIGFGGGFVLSPIPYLLTRHRASNSGILPAGVGLGLLVGVFLWMVGP